MHVRRLGGGMTTKTRAAAPTTGWRNRIVGHGEVAPRELVANPANWRTHPKEQQRALAGALDEVGWVQQVLVNQRTGHLVDGHLRVELAFARREPTVPVTYLDLAPGEEALVLATLDPIGAMATADPAKLEELLAGVTVDDAGLRRLLADLGPRKGLTDPDDVPEPSEEPYVKTGDLYRLGDHRLLCGDATKAEDVARLLDGAEPRLLATDPPYGVSLDPTWRDGVYNQLGPAERPYMRTAGHRNTTLSGDTRVDWSEAFALVTSLTVGYVWHAGVHAAAVAEGLIGMGFEIVSQVIWDKGLFAMGRSWYHWAHEPCWVVRRAGAVVPFLGERNQATIWRAPSPKMIMAGSTEEKFDHPAQKPVALFEAPIRNHLAPGEAVYDPFLGSGTTLVAAEIHGRRCYGLEIDPRYCQIAIERWQDFTGRTAERITDARTTAEATRHAAARRPEAADARTDAAARPGGGDPARSDVVGGPEGHLGEVLGLAAGRDGHGVARRSPAEAVRVLPAAGDLSGNRRQAAAPSRVHRPVSHEPAPQTGRRARQQDPRARRSLRRLADGPAEAPGDLR
jgi:DNA methylase